MTIEDITNDSNFLIGSNDETIIKDGQIVSIDVGVIYNGWHGDAARTFMVGNVSEEKRKLVKTTEECFFKAVEHLCDGTPLGNIGYNVQSHAESNGYSVVRALVGHGIGREMHEDPSVPNYGKKGTGIRLKKGMTIAIEPMINMGTYQVDFLRDGWSVVTRDRLPSAHYENTVAISDNDVEMIEFTPISNDRLIEGFPLNFFVYNNEVYFDIGYVCGVKLEADESMYILSHLS